MDNLSDNFKKLKERLTREQQKDQEKRKAFRKALFVVFEGKIVEKFIKDFFFKKGVMFLKATNKSFAQELDFKKTQLLREMKKKEKTIIKIVIF